MSAITARLGGRLPFVDQARGVLNRYHALIALTLYALGAVVTQRHAVGHLNSHVAANLPIDVTQFFWTMWWWPHALTHLENPFVTHAIWAPHGLNMAAVTGLPLPSVLMAPVTWLFGPIVAYNVLCLLAPVLSGWLTYRLCLRLTHAPAASIAGGWLFAFCSYALSQLGGGHPNLALTFGAPALLLLVARRLDREISARRFVALTFVVLAAQLLCNPEILFMLGVFGVIALLAAIATVPGDRRRAVIGLIVPLLIAAVITAVVCSPFIIYLLTGPQLSKGVDKLYFADLLSYVVPTPISYFGQQRFHEVSTNFFAGYVETGTYVGVPALIIFWGYAVGAWRRTAHAKTLVITAFIAAVLSLGTHLEIDGHQTMTLPYHLIGNLPGFTEALPVRLGLFPELAVAIGAAVWLAARASVWRWALLLLAVVSLWPNVNGVLPAAAGQRPQPVYNTSYTTPYAQFWLPPFFTHDVYKRYLKPGETILPLPYNDQGASLLWQAEAHGYFTLASGYFGYIPPVFYNDPVVGQLRNAIPFTGNRPQLRSFLRRHDVGAVVIQDGQGGGWPGLLTELGLHGESVGGVEVFAVTAAARAG